jgi:Tol biopolymer transport system component
MRGGEPGIDKLWVTTVDLDVERALRTDMIPLPAEIRSAQWAAWSPDGKEIAIEDNRGNGMRSLWIAHEDGSHAVKLLDYQGTTYGGLDWTADGKNIIYSALVGDGLQLFSVPRAGGAPRQLTHDSGNLMHPRVSPDGRWIACTRIVQSRQIWRRPLS